MRQISIVLIIALCLSCSCVIRPRQFTTAQIAPAPTSAPRINLNTATAAELETLPGIGKALAQRIVEHRQKYGPFRRTEHLIIVRGISDRRFRSFQNLVTVE